MQCQIKCFALQVIWWGINGSVLALLVYFLIVITKYLAYVSHNFTCYMFTLKNKITEKGKLDNAFCCTSSNVDLISTNYTNVIMSIFPKPSSSVLVLKLENSLATDRFTSISQEKSMNRIFQHFHIRTCSNSRIGRYYAIKYLLYHISS
jgi:hypothetical protein